MWSKLSNTFRKGDGESSSAQQVSVIGQVNYRSSDEQTVHPRDMMDEGPSEAVAAEPSGVMSPPGSPGKKRNLLKRASKILSEKDKKDSTLSLAKRVKSSLHLNTNINSSDMSLTSPTNGEGGNQQVFGSVRSLFSKDRRPSAMQMQAALNNSDDGFSKRSSEDMRPTTPSPMPPLSPLDAHQRYGSVRSILRDRNTPGSGQNVRFFSRDAYRVISPDVSVNGTNSSGDPDPTFMQRVQEVGVEHSNSGSLEEGVTIYHSAHASPHVASPVVSGSPNPLLLNSPPDASSTPYLASQGGSRQSISAPQMPIPPPELTGGINYSPAQEHGVHPIPEAEENPPQDRPAGIEEFRQALHQNSPVFSPTLRPKMSVQIENRVSSHSTVSTMSLETPNSIMSGTSSHRLSDEVVFHSAVDEEKEKLSLPPRSSSSLGLYKKFKRESTQSAIETRHPTDFPPSANTNRSRSLSERVFFRPSMDETKGLNNDAANTSVSSEPVPNKNKDEVPDPFRADASNYYNSAAGFPNSPPRISHVRADSGVSGISARSMRSASGLSHRSTRSQSSFSPNLASQARPTNDSDEMVIALRTQLAFHQELATQYERDLRARDAQAALMTQKLQGHEAEAERRARAMRGMRRRVAELERAAAALEEQAERSALENFERSVLDGASGDALKGLHQQIADLEKERNDLGRREKLLQAENEKLKEETQKRKEASSSSEQAANAEPGTEQQVSQEAERHREIELAWAEDRARLVVEMEALQQQIAKKDNEVSVLKSEVEAQWSNTEKLTGQAEMVEKEKERIAKEYEAERQQLKIEIAALEARTSEMEIEWTESENRKLELEREISALWEVRQDDPQLMELQEELRREQAQKDELRLVISNLENEVKVLKEEHQFDLDNTLRHDQIAQERQAEVSEYAQKLSTKERELEALQDELSILRREHARVQTEQARSLSDSEIRANDARSQLNEAIKAQAIAEVEAKQARERASSMEEELEKLRSKIHVMNQRSADQDVKILQLERQHEQDLEDKIGLNIALDSKQQELDLLKRNIGVRATGGATPAAPVRTARRESNLFRTPMPLRPSSALSDTSNTGKAPLGKSSKMNAAAPVQNSTTVKKVPRVSENATVTAPLRSRASIGSVARKAPVRPAGAPAPVMKRTASGSSARRASMIISGSGSMSEASSSMVSDKSDKENATPRPRAVTAAASTVASRRMSMQPLSVPA